MIRPKGTKIVYDLEQKPVSGVAINARFSGGLCLTICPHGRGAKVGSSSCAACDYYGGKASFAIATGESYLYGGCDHTMHVFCKFKGGH